MKRYRKKDMQNTVETLLKANDVVTGMLQVDPEGAVETLVECQESAILLGNSIEALGGKAVRLVQIIEDYCQNLYQMGAGFYDGELCRGLSKIIRSQLEELSRGIGKLPKDRKEVVFLPYKASMWDSLESVWKAADADQDTDAYVIPIPYFDKNPDGSFREEHYEGALYPDDVPITRYDEYDFGERMPDMILIHNPYDDCNLVTSVHPFFYTKNLKRFTDELVYIPYFILDEVDLNDKTAIEGMKHFCTVPGVWNADRVIVQSENMRLAYIKVLTEASGNTKEARAHWEKKILGLGSPKIDKIRNTRKEDLYIPDEWLKILQKPDGGLKKIILYNTGISSLLKNNEQFLEKMENVFQTFERKKEETALLWRPHPLIQSTLISMRPQLWEQYKALRDQYIREGWGIYDDTADLDRAVVLSDAYYGDLSSVVQLYQTTGKPIMIQNTEIITKIQPGGQEGF